MLFFERRLGFFCIIGIAFAVCGCGQGASGTRDAADYIDSWGEMGMYLPDQEQIRFFDEHFQTASAPLLRALEAPEHSIRMRAAYVIGELGTRAKDTGPHLLSRLREEPDNLVRMYIIDALNRVEFRSEEALAHLSEHFNSLCSLNVPPTADGSYPEVDEKIATAAALYRLGDGDNKAAYLAFVMKWLEPPGAINHGLLEGYWDRRWMAVNSLEFMPGATEAIPKLEAIRTEPDAKAWVEVHVPRVLVALRNGDES